MATFVHHSFRIKEGRRKRLRPSRWRAAVRVLATVATLLTVQTAHTPAATASGTSYFAAPSLVHDDGGGSMSIYRWNSTGSSFARTADYHSGPFHLTHVGDRVATGDVNGDGRPDIVMAYQENDNTFQFNVFLDGAKSAGIWYTSGIYDLDRVGDRLVVGDFNGDGKAEPALVYDDGDGTMTIYRWLSTGSSFTRTTDYHSGIFHLGNVDGRVASGDLNGDGKDDIVMAYQNSDGTFQYNVFPGGSSSAGVWYNSGPYNLDRVANRLVVGDFNGDGKAEPALVYDDGDGTMTIYRWLSTGSSFTRTTDYHSGSFHLGNVDNRVASGDVNFDGKDDIVMAYQKSDGTFQFNVFPSGSSSAGVWYTSGPYNLDPVGDRFVLRAWTTYTPPATVEPETPVPVPGSAPPPPSGPPMCPCIRPPSSPPSPPSPVCNMTDPNNWTYTGSWLGQTQYSGWKGPFSEDNEIYWVQYKFGGGGEVWTGRNACTGIKVDQCLTSIYRRQTWAADPQGPVYEGLTNWLVADNGPGDPGYPRFPGYCFAWDEVWGWVYIEQDNRLFSFS